MSATPAPPPAIGEHLLVSIGDGGWRAAPAAGAIPLELPVPLLPGQTQHVALAIYNPTAEPVDLAVTTEIVEDLPITAPGIVVAAPASIGPRSVATGEIRVTTPSWAGEDWMGQRVEARITIDADGASDAAGLAHTGTDPLSAISLAATLLAIGVIAVRIGRRRRRMTDACGHASPRGTAGRQRLTRQREPGWECHP